MRIEKESSCISALPADIGSEVWNSADEFVYLTSDYS